MQEPFCSVPVIWIIQEDTLANRLPVYEEMHWEHIISQWKITIARANVVVFPDYSLPVIIVLCFHLLLPNLHIRIISITSLACSFFFFFFVCLQVILPHSQLGLLSCIRCYIVC